MRNLYRVRSAADTLCTFGKYEDAYYLYTDVYNQLWIAYGTAHKELSEFSRSFMQDQIRQAIDFRSLYSDTIANGIVKRWFNLSLDQSQNEFIFALYGRLKCLCYSGGITDPSLFAHLLSEYFLLATMILVQQEEKWLKHAFRIFTPLVDDYTLKRLHENLAEKEILKGITAAAQELTETDWYPVNMLLLEHLEKTTMRGAPLYRSLSKIVGGYSGEQKRKYRSERQKGYTQNDFGRYEKYERYERYETYERYEPSAPQEKPFDSNTASQQEKVKHFTAVLGLKGKMTKSEIRSRYLELIAAYHPDKVEMLGTELKDLAEEKAKEINAAYEFLKNLYGF